MSDATRRTWLGRSYVGRHWHGELSLPVSYFVNGVLLAFACNLLVRAVPEDVGDLYEPWRGFLTLLAFWLAICGISLWQLVGTWRSAGRHVGRGGRRFWAVLARIMMVVGAIQVALTLTRHAGPQLEMAARIAMGDPEIPPYTLRIAGDGTEVVMSGGIRFGAADDLAALLDRVPTVRTVQLDSTGGRLAAGLRLQTLIRERGLDTYVGRRCLSACTTVFLGGQRRYLAPQGRLGFHGGILPGLDQASMTAFDRKVAEAAIAAGVSPDFAQRAFFLPNAEMWFPTMAELRAAGVVTDIAGDQFAVVDLPPEITLEEIVTEMQAYPIFAALAQAEPQTFAWLAAAYRDSLVAGRSESEILATLRTALSDTIRRLRPRADDATILAMGELHLERLEALGAADAEACRRYAAAMELTPEVAPILDRQSIERGNRIETDIILTGMSSRERAAEPERLDALYERLFDAIEARHDEAEILQKAADAWDGRPGMAADEVCRLSAILLRQALTLPPQDAAPLLLDLLALKD
ncbi:hypothetical protein ACFOGJ_11725 [Marinibaculum pumilum]|uniref:Uncharacterized protein n=1 Tax=Marinibaculum pumilum TaxID=1766165 RepID=A0ABV7KZT5_9PROT